MHQFRMTAACVEALVPERSKQEKTAPLMCLTFDVELPFVDEGC